MRTLEGARVAADQSLVGSVVAVKDEGMKEPWPLAVSTQEQTERKELPWVRRAPAAPSAEALDVEARADAEGLGGDAGGLEATDALAPAPLNARGSARAPCDRAFGVAEGPPRHWPRRQMGWWSAYAKGVEPAHGRSGSAGIMRAREAS